MSGVELVKSSVDKLWQRFMLSLGYARIQLTDDSQGVQFVQVKLGDREIIDKMPRLAEYGFSSNAPADSDAVIVFFGGDRSKGAVIATGNQKLRFRNLGNGDTVMYDARGRSILLSSAGVEIDANNSAVTVNNATIVTIHAASSVVLETPLLKVAGDIVDNYATNVRTMAGMRNQYNTHTHTDPQGGVTGGPNNTM